MTQEGKLIEEKSHCELAGHEQQEPHVCPFLVEIRNDEDTLCTCCKACEHECYMDT